MHYFNLTYSDSTIKRFSSEIYRKLSLTDLTGINYRYEARLNRAGIYSPLQFLAASQDRLKKQVFHSIIGYQWFARLRGWEVDNVVWDKKSVGHNYALGRKTRDINELSRLLMKLTHKVGRRMRSYGFGARGIYLALGFRDGYYWSKGYDTKMLLYSHQDIYHYAKKLLLEAYISDVVTHISVSVYGLVRLEPEQLSLFDGSRMDHKALSDACDKINDRYGEYTIVPAIMANMDDLILDRIAFGSVKDL